jgi:hypothetical protein
MHFVGFWPLIIDHCRHVFFNVGAEGLQKLGFLHIGMFPDKGIYVDWLPVAYFGGAAVAEEIGMIDSSWDYPGVTLPGTAESKACDAFFDGLETAFRPVCAFRKKAEGDIVLQDIVYCIEALIILAYMLKAVPLPDHGQDAKEMEDAGDGGFTEDIGPGTEGGGGFAAVENYQRVH